MAALPSCSPETTIFNLTDALGAKQYDKAASLLADLLADKDEPPEKQIILISEQFRRLYAARIEAVIAENRYPAYKSSGMAYVEFAIEERELFKLLFMRDRDAAERADDSAVGPIYSLIAENVGVDIDTAKLIHLETWAFVHGIAAMIVTDYYVPDTELISSMMTDVYEGLKSRFGGAK